MSTKVVIIDRRVPVAPPNAGWLFSPQQGPPPPPTFGAIPFKQPTAGQSDLLPPYPDPIPVVPSGHWNQFVPPSPSPFTRTPFSNVIVPRTPTRVPPRQEGMPEKIDPRQVRMSETVVQILNGLTRNANIAPVNAPDDWRVIMIPRTATQVTAFNGELYIDSTTLHLMWKDTNGSVHQIV